LKDFDCQYTTIFWKCKNLYGILEFCLPTHSGVNTADIFSRRLVSAALNNHRLVRRLLKGGCNSRRGMDSWKKPTWNWPDIPPKSAPWKWWSCGLRFSNIHWI